MLKLFYFYCLLLLLLDMLWDRDMHSLDRSRQSTVFGTSTKFIYLSIFFTYNEVKPAFGIRTLEYHSEAAGVHTESSMIILRI